MAHLWALRCLENSVAKIVERTNALEWKSGKNTLGSSVGRKAEGYRNLRVRYSVSLLNAIGTGRVIELNCIVTPSARNGQPLGIYRQARVLNDAFDGGNWHEIEFLFKGFDTEEYEVLIQIERRNDATTYGTASHATVFYRFTAGISE